jgi:putative SOS response-associated peptidase YedK
MCNLYFDHDQPRRDPRAVSQGEPVCRQPRSDAGRVSGLSSAGHPQCRSTRDEAELAMVRWGMPPPPRTGGPPVTNIRNTSSPHWRGWLKPENRCLVLANSFAEYAPEPNPLFAFAGRARTIGGGDAHRVFSAAQNCSVTAVVSSVTFQPFVSAFSLANFCSI